MRRSVTYLASACGVLAATIAPSALALSQAWATITVDGITFTDLDAGDGTTPALTISNINLRTLTEAVNNAAPNRFDVTFRPATTSFDAVSVSAPVPPGFAVSSQVQFSGGQSGTLGADAFANIFGNANTDTQLTYDFVLTPFSQVTFTGVLSTYGETVGAGAGTNNPDTQDQFAAAGANIAIESNFLTDGSVGNNIASNIGPASAGQLDNSLNYTLTMTNETSSPWTGTMLEHVTAVASNSALAAAVPEPSTCAMLIAGLGLMGTVAFRRKR